MQEIFVSADPADFDYRSEGRNLKVIRPSEQTPFIEGEGLYVHTNRVDRHREAGYFAIGHSPFGYHLLLVETIPGTEHESMASSCDHRLSFLC